MHLNASSGGGAFVFAQRLSHALNARMEVSSKHLVYSGKPGDYALYADHFIARTAAFGWHALEKLDFLRFEKDKSIRFAFSHALTGVDITRHPLFVEADIIHLHWINKGFISLKGLEKIYESGKKVIWTAHDLWPFTGGCYHPRGCENFHIGCGNCKYLRHPKDGDLSSRVLSSKLDLYSKYVPQLVVPGRWSYSMACKSELAPYAQIVQIPNFIDTDVFVPLEQNRRLDGGPLRLLFSSMNLLNPMKGIFDLANAINQLEAALREKLELVLIGWAKSDLPLIHCNVTVKGILSQTQELVSEYQQADVLVVPSFEETFGLTCIEAQSCGVPVIAYASGELAYNVIQDKTGFLVPTGDVAGLKSAIEKFAEMSAAQRVLMGENARQFVVQHFGTDQTVKKYTELYLS